ncbi:hypothetical protein HDU91_004325, partial [Kappamyces sp. JEL0680]
WSVAVWYYSPYPLQQSVYQETVWICPACLHYHTAELDYAHHVSACAFQTPGQLIYRQRELSLYMVDGRQDKFFTQCLCLAAKLFLDHKTIMFDLEPFLFFVLVRQDATDREVLGFFSKEKQSPEHHNVSCILVFPQYQGHGYGRLLIEMSYELYRQHGLVGGPERPLSDLGLVGYKRYWVQVVLCLLVENPRLAITIKDLAIATAFRASDILVALDEVGLLGYWNEATGSLCIPHARVKEAIAAHRIVFKRLVDPGCFLPN